jgi:energy coupling factor transporter S component ThiW
MNDTQRKTSRLVADLVNVKKISLAAVLIALGVIIASFLKFPVLTSMASPGQHMINGLAGVLLGPVWAVVIAICIGSIRIMLALGTIFSMPGGIPGALVVGLFHLLMKRLGQKYQALAALTEPIGTLFIGVPLAVYIVAPLQNMEWSLVPILFGWALSCIPGAIFSFIILETLRRTGLIERIVE